MDSKKCSKCGVKKSISEFFKDKSKKDGMESRCKDCCGVAATTYVRSIPGLITVMYSTQISSSKKRGMNLPNYNKLELLDWIKNTQNFDELYNNWVRGGYAKNDKPSIDRLDDYKPYTLNNIRLTTWKKNNKKGHIDRMNGKNRKQLSGVVKYSLDDVKLEEYYSIRCATRITKVDQSSIVKCCKGKQKIAGGFKWKYKEMK